ncbi:MULTISPECIES: transporter [unclassified Streptomyces]|uniref:transporter n=1 Tax=unclassified Streptomyces TaxID=2593676 RepID=UPI00336AD03D
MKTAATPRPGAQPTRARLRPSGPLWPAWRRQRAALLTGGALVLVLAGYIVYQRTGMVALIRDRNLTGCRLWYPECHGRRLSSDDGRPTPLGRAFADLDAYRSALLHTGRLLLAIPAIIGTSIGAPLVAREIESGTAKLVWSQSAGRTRWLLATLALPAAATLAATTLLAALFTWWWWPVRGMVFEEVSWVTAVPFEVAGPAPVAFALLSLVLGTAFGLLLRRTVPAMACTLALTVGSIYGLRQMRPHLMPPLTTTANPGSHFWPMQWIQAGICLGAAALLAAFCLWWIRHRRP